MKNKKYMNICKNIGNIFYYFILFFIILYYWNKINQYFIRSKKNKGFNIEEIKSKKIKRFNEEYLEHL